MLWYLKEPSQWDSSFEHPKHMFDGSENNNNFTLIKFHYLDLWITLSCSFPLSIYMHIYNNCLLTILPTCSCAAWADPEIFSQRVMWTSLEGVCTSISKETYGHLWFSRRGPDPCPPPPPHTHTSCHPTLWIHPCAVSSFGTYHISKQPRPRQVCGTLCICAGSPGPSLLPYCHTQSMHVHVNEGSYQNLGL